MPTSGMVPKDCEKVIWSLHLDAVPGPGRVLHGYMTNGGETLGWKPCVGGTCFLTFAKERSKHNVFLFVFSGFLDIWCH